MGNLDNKYRNNKIKPDELEELKKYVNSSTDDELSSSMQDSWLNEPIDTSRVDDERIEKIKKKVLYKINKRKTNYLSFTFLSKVAATVLLPIFILSTLFLYKEKSSQMDEDMVVSTSEGEKASITLPDGTIINLNEKTRLTYSPENFNKANRIIHFDGEGYFHVSKDREHPFFINARGLQIKVLGTKFNLLARKSAPSAELLLEEGNVSFTSLKMHTSVFIKPCQKAIMDRLTGKIRIIDHADIQKTTAWKRNEMIFVNKSLSYVLQAIKRNYNINIRTTYQDSISDSFTGTIPSTNLNEALEVIEKSYHLKGTIAGKYIILTGTN